MTILLLQMVMLLPVIPAANGIVSPFKMTTLVFLSTWTDVPFVFIRVPIISFLSLSKVPLSTFLVFLLQTPLLFSYLPDWTRLFSFCLLMLCLNKPIHSENGHFSLAFLLFAPERRKRPMTVFLLLGHPRIPEPSKGLYMDGKQPSKGRFVQIKNTPFGVL
jgi:hypothetical protein